MSEGPVLVAAGPTASGKSALAMRLAQSLDGVLICADALQLYRDAPILSAAPSDGDKARVPHLLYGILSPDETSSAAHWASLASSAITAVQAQGKLPILVGGTGLYLKALMHGLSPMPDVPASLRETARALAAEIGARALHARLAGRDPVMAARLRPSDTQRVTRAWEVLEATGRSLAEWQAGAGKPFPARWFSILLDPPRTELYEACNARFLTMVEAGGLEEAQRFIDAPSSLPLLKTLGLKELIRHLKGEIEREEAITLAQASTRRYAKRQVTWFRHQMRYAAVHQAQFSESFLPEILPKIRQFLLTAP